MPVPRHILLAQRREVLPGYPAEPLKSRKELLEYFDNSRITCLLCGKTFKRLGNHLQPIHEITEDEYRERFNIPWTYGLVGKEAYANYSRAIRKRMARGYRPPMKLGEKHVELVNTPRRSRPSFPVTENLGRFSQPKRPMEVGPAGELETYTAKRERLKAKRGTAEYKEKMRARPQCQPEVVRERIGNYWRGRKQSAEHIAKRFKKEVSDGTL